ncbi:AGC protein kinase [Thecamonas trahens ATCC 50062]|uniref:AGC protein kinase n=1 Tax=Thecamonas trahens ATCC 50062 TaxID=461836 RepID=A0A0L0D4C1_THETB|nr:AGC protein kinase [Thecamonas trahens ATCC 50062]KNC47075.1 AGC protein kinase [Thecamonas trahens ATCC 50062]|eukprot:XP_013759855.1 AGC protein kinase [Thecamonas trahens ATCC 50062]
MSKSALTQSLLAEGAADGGGGRSGSGQGGTSTPSLDDFEVLYKIGTGLVGQVYLVRHVGLNTTYAMKVIPKAFVLETNMYAHAQSECHILRSVSHPFVVRLVFSFQTPESLVLIMEFMHGGDMAFLLRRRVMLREDEVRFYAAEIATALVFLHSQSIVHRDLKCGNILLDIEGHVCLTDFGFAKRLAPEASAAHTYCGTGAYMAPEILAQDAGGHGFAADWWSFGVVLFEMLTGGKPFGLGSPAIDGTDEDALASARLAAITSSDLVFPDFPALSDEAKDLLVCLLDRNPHARLDGPGVMAHPFFAGLDWDAVVDLELEPPWEPYIEYSDDEDEFIECFPSSLTDNSPISRMAASPSLARAARPIASSPAASVPASAVAVFPAFSYTSPSTASALGLVPAVPEAASDIPAYQRERPLSYRHHGSLAGGTADTTASTDSGEASRAIPLSRRSTLQPIDASAGSSPRSPTLFAMSPP